MDGAQFWPYVLTMAGVTYLIRMLPLAAIRGRIRSPFLQAFLRYMPYAVLGAMTFPAVFTCAGSVPASLAGLLVGLLLAYLRRSLLTVAFAACAAAYLVGVLL